MLQYLVRYGTPPHVQGTFLLAPPFWGSDSDWDYEAYALPPNFADKLSRKTPLFQPCELPPQIKMQKPRKPFARGGSSSGNLR